MKLLPLALAALNGSARTRLTGIKTTAKHFAVVGILAAVSAVFLLVALTILLSARIGAVYACLVMSAIFAVLALIAFLHHRRSVRLKQMEVTETVALASAAETSSGAGAIMLARAFMRGFLGSSS